MDVNGIPVVYEYHHRITERALLLACEQLLSCPHYEHDRCQGGYEHEPYPDCDQEQGECWARYFENEASKEIRAAEAA